MAPALIDPYLWVADDRQASEAHVGVKGIRVAVWVLGEPTCHACRVMELYVCIVDS